jgi:hypothetical protein
MFSGGMTMQRFHRVALAVGSVLLCSGFAFGQARLGPYVVDSNGLKVGHVFNGDVVFVFINGELVSIAAGQQGFEAIGTTLYFAEAGCAGTPYLQTGPSESTGALYSDGYFTTDGFFHYVSMASATALMPLSSLGLHGDGSLATCNATGGGPFSAAPALTAPAPSFAPPFKAVEALPVSPAPATATFLDVPTDNPYFRFVEALAASGITAGCGGGNYCPNNPVTRGQMAVFVSKLVGLN